MKKQYLSVLLFLALVLGTSSMAFANDADLNHDNGALTPELRGSLFEDRREEIRTEFEVRRTAIEAQREQMRADAEIRRAEAEAQGDEFKARREVARLELEERRAEIDAKREARRVEFELKRTEMQAKRVEFQYENAVRKVDRTTRVMTAMIERLTKIGDRIQSRIGKIQDKGGETEKSQYYLGLAIVNLADAQVAVGTFVNIDLLGDSAQENYEKIRKAAADAREFIRATHENLMLAVRSLSAVEIDIEDDNSDENDSDE